MSSTVRRARALLALALFGAVLEFGLVMLWTLSYQLTQQQRFTDVYLGQYAWLSRLLHGVLGIASAVVSEAASPRAPAELGPWFAPLAAAFVISCGVAAAGYLGALWLLDRGMLRDIPALQVVLILEVVFSATVFTAPGLLSQDIFGYLAYGQIAAIHGYNPYIWPPSAFAHDALLPWVAPIWRSLPSPYGPVWTDVSWTVAWLVRDRPITEQVIAYKALATALHAATLAALWWLLGRLLPDGSRPQARLTAFTAYAWNPLVLTEIVGNGHNDALAIALLVAALIPLAAPRVANPRLVGAAALVTLSGLVKYMSGIAGVFFVVAYARRTATGRGRIARLIVIGGASLVVVLAAFGPWLALPDSLDPIFRQTDGDLYANAVPDLVSLTIGDQVLAPAGMGVGPAHEAARLAMKLVVDGLFLAYIVWELRRVWSVAVTPRAALSALIRASVRASLIIILVVSIWVQAWYFILPLSLAVLLGPRSLLARVSVGYTLTAFPTLYFHYYLQDAAPGWIYIAYAGLPLLPVVLMRLRRLSATQPATTRSSIARSYDTGF